MSKAKNNQAQVVHWLAESGEGFRWLMENIPMHVYIKNTTAAYLYGNRRWADFLGMEPDEIVGKTDAEIFGPKRAEELAAEDRTIMKTGIPLDSEVRHVRGGEEFFMRKYKGLVKDEKGKILGLLGIAWDVTNIKEAEEIMTRQAQEIMELSTPVMQVWEGVLVAPLIGMLDSQRTQHFMERFLETITDTQSPVALLDITGVPTVDTATAQYLTEAITAARLLGTKVILTGVQPAIARTLVQLGVDLSDFETHSSLAGGLRLALKSLNLEIVS